MPLKPVSIQFNCKNSIQNAPKLAPLSSKIETFSGEGAQPPPKNPSPVGRGTPLPTGGGVLGGGCAPSPENVSIFELKKASFGAFGMLFLQLN